MVSYYRDNITYLEDMIIIFLQTCILGNNSFICSLTLSSTRIVSTHIDDLNAYNNLYLVIEKFNSFVMMISISHHTVFSLEKLLRLCLYQKEQEDVPSS